MHLINTYLWSALAAAALMLPSAIHAQVSLQGDVLGSGGTTSADGSYVLSGTLGQTVIGPTTDVTNVLWQGFWYAAPDAVLAGVVDAFPGSAPEGTVVLHQNIPNPFSSMTQVQIDLPTSCHVSLKVYDNLGHEVLSAIDGEHEAGSFVVTLDGSNLPAGRYAARLLTDGATKTIGMLVVR